MQRDATIDELKYMIARKLDVAEFLDVIGYTIFDLVEVLEDEIEQNYDELIEACR